MINRDKMLKFPGQAQCTQMRCKPPVLINATIKNGNENKAKAPQAIRVSDTLT